MKYVLGIVFCFIYSVQYGQESIGGVTQALNDYITGTSYNYPEQIDRAFIPEANLYLNGKNNDLRIVPIQEYLGFFEKGKPGTFTGRVGNILAIDTFGNIASAKAEILIPEAGIRFVDLFLLKRIEGKWKIISKTADRQASNQSGERILFILSNAHFYGESNLMTANSFPEIANAYMAFKDAGYTVDFVSPQGGAVPIGYINGADSVQKACLYNTDLMAALKATKSPEQITPQDYRAVHYIGGGSAMFGVADHPDIQRIAMEIYEQHDGIISSVCHGSAGIINLKTKDGNFLVAGRRVSGYPEEYERKDRPYYKTFPFSIQATIENRGGTFKYSPPNQPHVQVDGRIITGQNYVSSKPVAEAIISALKNKKIE